MSLKPRSVPSKQLVQNLASTGMVFYPNNTLDWDDVQLSSADFGSQLFILFRNPQNTQMELMEADPASVTSANAVTILKRGLPYDGTQTANTETKYDWNAFETIIEFGSDTPQFMQYLKDYIDSVGIAGAPNATTSLQGLSELATQAEVDAGTATGGSGASLVPTPALIRAKKYNDYTVDAVGTDAYAITPTPAITAYAAGQEFTFKAGTANTGGVTLAVSGLTAKAIKKNYSQALVTGDILQNQIVKVVYDSVNDCFQMVSPPTRIAPEVQTVTATGAATWTKPTNASLVRVQLWAGGGSGAKSSASAGASGGGGGGYKEVWFNAADLGATEPISVAAGGAAQTSANTAGNVGGNTTFGASATLVTAYGGGGGKNGDTSGEFGGGGGGALAVGASGTTGAGGGPVGGTSTAGAAPTGSTFGGGGGGSGATSGAVGKGGDSYYGGGGGGGAGTATIIGGDGGVSVYGGGGGGGNAFDSSPGAGAGGVSSYGGNGGAGAYDSNNGTAGAQPGGGGGGSELGDSGKGGDGKAIITTYY